MKKILFKTTFENSPLNEVSITILRIVPAILMATLHGLGKTPPSEKFLMGVTSLGFPLPIVFAWAAALSEFLGGIFLALGFLTRPVAILLSITMLVAAFGVHLSDPWDIKESSLIYLVISLVFACRGAGRFSIDAFFNKK